jgi:Flp pilus assembly pilin Flp
MFSFIPKFRTKKAQGLVEYALILVLVAVIVIAVLVMLGPRIGGTFSSVNNSLSGVANGSGAQATLAAPTTVPTAAPTATPVWTYAATENGTVNIPSGTHQIQYGANGQYFYQTFTGPTTVGCNNGTFGDPDPGHLKTCSIQ